MPQSGKPAHCCPGVVRQSQCRCRCAGTVRLDKHLLRAGTRSNPPSQDTAHRTRCSQRLRGCARHHQSQVTAQSLGSNTADSVNSHQTVFWGSGAALAELWYTVRPLKGAVLGTECVQTQGKV